MTGPRVDVRRERTQLSPMQERLFRQWYTEQANRIGIDPDPDNPAHKYDYRGAWLSGASTQVDPTDGLPHWPSSFKDDDHPNRFVRGVGDTKSLDRGLGPTIPTTNPNLDRQRKELAKIAQAIRDGRLPPAAMQRYIERERITPEMEAARTPLTAAETLGGAVSAVNAGTMFNMGDEIAGGLSGVVRGALSPTVSIPQAVREDIGEQRQQLGQFREANPGAALGLELGGGLLGGLGIAKAAGAGASGLNAAQRAARVAASGAGGGAIAGYGSGEGSPVSGDRLVRSAVGAGAGYAGGKLLTALAPAWASSVAGDQMVTDDVLALLGRAGTAPGAAAGTAAANVVPGAVAPPAPVPTKRLYRVEPSELPDMSDPATASREEWLRRSIGEEAYNKYVSERGRLFVDDLSMLENYGHGAPDRTTYVVDLPEDRATAAMRRHHSDPFNEYLLAPEDVARKSVFDPSASPPSAVPAATSTQPTVPPVVPVKQVSTGRSPQGVSEAAQRAAARAIGPTAPARSLLQQLEKSGMGEEALAMNVGGDRTVRAVRAAANMPSSDAGQLVNERLARQGGRLGEQVPRDIGDVTGVGSDFPEVTLRNMQRDLTAKVEAGYDAFRALPEVPLDPTDEAQRQFIERYVNPVIQNRRLSGRLTNASALSGENVDAAFKNLQREIRGGQAAVGIGNKGLAEVQGLEAMRDRVLAAIGEMDPNYAELGRTYALDDEVGKVVQEAFQSGRDIRTPGQAIVAREAAQRVPGSERALQAGNVASLQSAARRGASNADLGDMSQFRDVARAVVGTPEARETFIALHGQDAYEELLSRLMPKIRAAAQNAAARGNSTTAKQLMDALAFGDDAALDALNALASGSPTQGVMRNMIGRAISPAQQAMRLGIGQTATETADLLTTKGAPQIRSLLDLLEQLGQTDVARRQAVRAPASAIAGRVAGRNP